MPRGSEEACGRGMRDVEPVPPTLDDAGYGQRNERRRYGALTADMQAVKVADDPFGRGAITHNVAQDTSA